MYGDHRNLLRVIERLVKDAIKSSSEGEITISVEVIEGKVMVYNQEWLSLLKIHLADNKDKDQKTTCCAFSAR